MKYKYGFLVDSASSYKLDAKDNIWKIPILINVEDKEGNLQTFQEGVDIDTNKIIDYLNQDYKVFTAQPNIIKTQEIINDILNQCETLIVITLSKGLSGFNANLQNIYHNNNRVIVVDSKCVSIQANWYISDLKQLIDNNQIELNKASINNFFQEKYKKTCGVCILSNLDQLIKGGRLKGFKKFIAQLFKLKISVKYDGELNFWDKNVSLEGAVAKSIAAIDKEIHMLSKGIKRIALMNQLTNQEDGKILIDKILKKLKINSYDEAELPGAVVAHVGANTFSILIEAN